MRLPVFEFLLGIFLLCMAFYLYQRINWENKLKNCNADKDLLLDQNKRLQETNSALQEQLRKA